MGWTLMVSSSIHIPGDTNNDGKVDATDATTLAAHWGQTGDWWCGDCNGDGVVLIGELQKAINMFLGTLAPDCGADCDGDGGVTIGELQKVINVFLGFPASC